MIGGKCGQNVNTRYLFIGLNLFIDAVSFHCLINIQRKCSELLQPSVKGNYKTQRALQRPSSNQRAPRAVAVQKMKTCESVEFFSFTSSFGAPSDGRQWNCSFFFCGVSALPSSGRQQYCSSSHSSSISPVSSTTAAGVRLEDNIALSSTSSSSTHKSSSSSAYSSRSSRST